MSSVVWLHIYPVVIGVCTVHSVQCVQCTVQIENLTIILTLSLLTWRIWWAPNNANRWQMGFNSAFKGLIEVPCTFYYFVLWPTNAQLFHKFSHSYMFRHYRVILWEFVINSLPSYARFVKQVLLIQFIISHVLLKSDC